MDGKEGNVYVLINSAMPGLVKIGITTNSDIEVRLNQLYNTSVPVPFECVFAGLFEDCKAVEKALHVAFSPYRINTNREFFKIEPEQVIALLKTFCKKDVTPQIRADYKKDIKKEDFEASEDLKRGRRNVMNFRVMGIKIGDKINFTQPETEKPIDAEIIDDRKVKYNGKEYFLTKLTRELLQSEYDIQPSPYWTYKGRLLKDIYEETYGN